MMKRVTAICGETLILPIKMKNFVSYINQAIKNVEVTI